MKKQYIVEQYLISNNETISRFESGLDAIVPYYDGYHFEGEWLILTEKNYGAKDFAHRIKISENEFDQYIDENNRKKEEKLAMFEMMTERYINIKEA